MLQQITVYSWELHHQSISDGVFVNFYLHSLFFTYLVMPELRPPAQLTINIFLIGTLE